MALSKSKTKIKLSPSEERLLALLPKSGKKITTRELLEKYYDGEPVPYHGRTIISGLVRSLTAKRRNIKRTDRAGPWPIYVWIEK